MCTDLIAIATLAPVIVIGGPSVGDTVLSTIAALAVLACAPFLAALLPVRWACAVTATSLLARVGMCAAAAYSLTHSNFSADTILFSIAALWAGRALANESISRVTSAQFSTEELKHLSIANTVAPAMAACAWLGWLHLPPDLLPPASILVACACSYMVAAIVFFFWKELWTPERSITPAVVSHSVSSFSRRSRVDSRNNFRLAHLPLQAAATLLLAVQFSLALSENYFPPPHAALHRDLLIMSFAWILAGIGLQIATLAGLASRLDKLVETRFLLMIAAVGLAPLVVFPGKQHNVLFIAINAVTACLISIECGRIRMGSTNRWLNATTTFFCIIAVYAVAVCMLVQQPVAATYSQWRTLAAVCEGVLILSFLIWPEARAALVASVSYLVQRPAGDMREPASTTIYLADSMSLGRAAMASSQLQATLVLVTDEWWLQWKPVTFALRYLGVRIANPDDHEFPFHIRDALGDVVVYWMSTTSGFFERNSRLIDVCFPTVSVTRLTVSAAKNPWQPWRKTVAISKVVPVTKSDKLRR